MAWEEEKRGGVGELPVKAAGHRKVAKLMVFLGWGIAGLSLCQELTIQCGEKQETCGTGGKGLAWGIGISCMVWVSGWILLCSLLCLLQKDPGFDRGQFHKQIAVMRGQVSCA